MGCVLCGEETEVLDESESSINAIKVSSQLSPPNIQFSSTAVLPSAATYSTSSHLRVVNSECSALPPTYLCHQKRFQSSKVLCFFVPSLTDAPPLPRKHTLVSFHYLLSLFSVKGLQRIRKLHFIYVVLYVQVELSKPK
jgi:hypothetical protein